MAGRARRQPRSASPVPRRRWDHGPPRRRVVLWRRRAEGSRRRRRRRRARGFDGVGEAWRCWRVAAASRDSARDLEEDGLLMQQRGRAELWRSVPVTCGPQERVWSPLGSGRMDPTWAWTVSPRHGAQRTAVAAKTGLGGPHRSASESPCDPSSTRKPPVARGWWRRLRCRRSRGKEGSRGPRNRGHAQGEGAEQVRCITSHHYSRSAGRSPP